MNVEQQKWRVALESEPARESLTVKDCNPPWSSRQSDLEFFSKWLTAWRAKMCTEDFLADLREEFHGQL